MRPNLYENLLDQINKEPKVWLVTGVAGFIGSNLLETLLKNNQQVIGLDNFIVGNLKNLKEVESRVSFEQWKHFTFFEGDICNLDHCKRVCSGVDYVLHQAALGSVPRSISDPVATNLHNINGFLNMLVAAKEVGVKRFVYAASSSTYGDHPDLPKIESKIGRPLSPYAVTKLVNELYADVFARVYGFKAIGLRYFNVFGARQDPDSAYAAVIPKWTAAMIKGEDVVINGDGFTSRDFCHVENVVQANLLAATTTNDQATNQIYNVAVGEQTSLNELYKILHDCLVANSNIPEPKLKFGSIRIGDVRHSLADISKAKALLGYRPSVKIREGVSLTIPWYLGLQQRQGL